MVKYSVLILNVNLAIDNLAFVCTSNIDTFPGGDFVSSVPCQINVLKNIKEH